MATPSPFRLGNQSVLLMAVLAAGAAEQMTAELAESNPSVYRRWQRICASARGALSSVGADPRAATLALIG